MKKYIIILISILLVQTIKTNSSLGQKSEGKHAKNIILLIGDGMGLPQIYGAYTRNHSNLNILNMPYTGLSKTNSSDKYITDSGAGGTAISTGHKTNNHMIATDTSGHPLETILEIAEKHGLSTGLVVTSSITDATPAVFVSHEINRTMQDSIAFDISNSNIDVFIGGGKNFFIKRKDGKDLTIDLKKKGYQICYSIDEIKNAKNQKLAGLLADVGMPDERSGRNEMLSFAAQKAINILNNNQNGFFLMIEGSQIDWSGHDNDFEGVVAETIDFDKVVGEALDFAKKDGHTLVIVTADHETGGLTLTDGDLTKAMVTPNFSTKVHTAVPVPVFAFGVGAEKFSGFYENTSIFDKMLSSYGFNK